MIFDLALTRLLWQVQIMAAAPNNSSLCRDAGDDLITVALRSRSEEMKRKHCHPSLLMWKHMMASPYLISFQISKTKWNGADQMRRRESFNCVTHPHSTSCSKTVPLLCRNGHCVEWVENNTQTQLQTQTHLTYKDTWEVFFKLHKPGYQKTTRVLLSPAILQKPSSLWWELRCQPRTERQRQAQSTDPCHPLSMAPKRHKADSEMPPRDFLEELIYSI